MRAKCLPTFAGALALLLLPALSQGQVPGGFEPAGAGIPLFRPAGSVAAIARATESWVPVPTDPHDMLGAYRFLPTYATDDTEGQVFELLEVETGGEIADSIGQFVAVPWTVGCGCAEEGWDEPAWVTPGDTVVFLLTRTRVNVPWEGPPVFDVLGWHQPYPVGDFIPYWRSTRDEPETWLSVRQFFELLTVLPAEAAFELDPMASRESIGRWLEEYPDLEKAFPVPTILRELGRLAEGR